MTGHFTFPDQAPGDHELRSSTEHQNRAMQLMHGAENLSTGSATQQLTAAQAHLLAAILAVVRDEKTPNETEPVDQQQERQHPLPPPQPSARVRVFHNADRTAMAGGYTAEHAVVEVYAYDDTNVTSDTELCERAFELFNGGDDGGSVDHRALEYRDRGNRSLSVGDVVAIDGRCHACMPIGWQPIAPPRQIQAAQPGTAPLH